MYKSAPYVTEGPATSLVPPSVPDGASTPPDTTSFIPCSKRLEDASDSKQLDGLLNLQKTGNFLLALPLKGTHGV